MYHYKTQFHASDTGRPIYWPAIIIYTKTASNG